MSRRRRSVDVTLLGGEFEPRAANRLDLVFKHGRSLLARIKAARPLTSWCCPSQHRRAVELGLLVAGTRTDLGAPSPAS